MSTTQEEPTNHHHEEGGEQSAGSAASPPRHANHHSLSVSRPQSAAVVSNSIASFGPSDVGDVVRVDDDDEMLAGDDVEQHENDEGSGDDRDPSSPTTSLELALSIAVERPSTAEVVVPDAASLTSPRTCNVRPHSATPLDANTPASGFNNLNYDDEPAAMSPGSLSSRGRSSSVIGGSGFSTIIEVGITSEQGKRSTMEDRHAALIGNAKAAKHTGAGLLKSTTPQLASSSSPATPIPALSTSLHPTTQQQLEEEKVSSTSATNPPPPQQPSVRQESSSGSEGTASTTSSSGVDVGPSLRGVLGTGTNTTTGRSSRGHEGSGVSADVSGDGGPQRGESPSKEVNPPGDNDAERASSPKEIPASSSRRRPHQGARPSPGRTGAMSTAFHRAPSPNTRRLQEEQEQRQREEEEEASLRAEVKLLPEDRMATGIPFFAVYDGHGGTKCASYLRMKLSQFVLSHPKLISDPEEALHDGILQAEEEFLAFFGEADASGATAAVALFVGDSLVTANVGDTEMVLSRNGQAILLSTKHTPKDNPEEKQRVLDAGGKVVHGGRVGHPRFNPNVLHVALSRAMGDAPFKLPELTLNRPSGIIATPSTLTTPIHPNDEFVIIGCDGLWDVMTYQEAVDFCRDMLLEGAHQGGGEEDHGGDNGGSGAMEEASGRSSGGMLHSTKYHAQDITDALVHHAIQKGSNDNVTVLLLLYKQRPRSASHRPPSSVVPRWHPPPPSTPIRTQNTSTSSRVEGGGDAQQTATGATE